jgi:hypothetical protein
MENRHITILRISSHYGEAFMVQVIILIYIHIETK